MERLGRTLTSTTSIIHGSYNQEGEAEMIGSHCHTRHRRSRHYRPQPDRAALLLLLVSTIQSVMMMMRGMVGWRYRVSELSE